MTWINDRITRRRFVAASALSAVALATACSDDDGSEEAQQPSSTAAGGVPAATAATADAPQTLSPTPACGDADDVTVEQTEGPFFTPGTPERQSLIEPGMAGTRLVVTGTVFSTDCRPIAGALLDFWQADNDGVYDNEGFRLRGHQFAGADGTFRLETIVPGLYPGRTRHVHVKAQARDKPVLTTQLYFPGERSNSSDGIFDDALVMDVVDAPDGKTATFNFVLDVS